MNTRICSVIASVTLLTLSSGCGSTRNFLFGRGARCGTCRPSASTAPAYTTAPTYAQPQPLVTVPNASVVPVAPYQPRCRLFGRQPRYQQPVASAPPAGCGCQNPCGNVYPEGCGTCSRACGECVVASPCGGCGSACGACECGSGCGGFVDGRGPLVTDPYLQSEVGSGVMPYNGQIISDQVVGEQVIGGQSFPSSTAPILPDNFNARKFDSDGNRILWEEPLPQGTTSL